MEWDDYDMFLLSQTLLFSTQIFFTLTGITDGIQHVGFFSKAHDRRSMISFT